jgi:hypothetical protein
LIEGDAAQPRNVMHEKTEAQIPVADDTPQVFLP